MKTSVNGPSAKTDISNKIISGLVYLFERIMPDPFVLSIGLTVFVCILAFVFAPHVSLPLLLTTWYQGTFGILAFALQMILILATGYAIADAPIVQSGLRRVASLCATPTRAALVVFPIVALAAWLNWGLGLIVGAFLAREIAKRVEVDFAWLVAGSYSAWSICNSGLSSSIALSQASSGNPLNLVEKATGHLVPLVDTVFAPFVLIPTVIVVLVMTGIFIKLHPSPENTISFRNSPASSASSTADESAKPQSATDHVHGLSAAPHSFAAWAEHSFLGSLFLLVMGCGYLGVTWYSKGFDLDINTTILIFLLVGIALQRSPIAYANAIRKSAAQIGSMLLQYPIYGGIMGIMTGTGLAAIIAKSFVAISTPVTLPIFSFLSSLIITLLIPSAGGHWAVQGPFVLPAALALHASVAHTAMGVAMAENVSNMLQPFWAIPIVAIAGIRIQRVMGYTAVTFVVTFVIYLASLWLIR